MSRARAMKQRLPRDAYQTPAPLARAICERLYETVESPTEIMEPSAGSGAFVVAAREVWPAAHVTANEIDRGRRSELLHVGAHVVLHEDWTLLARGLANAQDEEAVSDRLVLGNPPFRHAREHIEAALGWLRPLDRLAFLLRLNFLGSTARVDFWQRPGLVSVAPIAPRPSFTGGGTDGTEYGLFVWVKGYRGATRLQKPITWEPVRRRRAA